MVRRPVPPRPSPKKRRIFTAPSYIPLLGHSNDSAGSPPNTDRPRFDFSTVEVLDVLPAFAVTLIVACQAEPSTVFQPATLEELRVMRREDQAAYEKLRAELKALPGMDIKRLDKLLSGHADEKPFSPSDRLLAFCKDTELFYTPDKIAYADIWVEGHRETHKIRSSGFERWLRRRYYEETRSAPTDDALQKTLSVVEARAFFEGTERLVFLRVARHHGRIYLDLGDPTWRAIQISRRGWDIVTEPAPRFRRTPNMAPLPIPERGGSLLDLTAFMNLEDEDDLPLLAAWLLAAMLPDGPFPILALVGEQGSAKTTTAAMLRKLIDPNTALSRGPPINQRDIFVSATNNWVLSFDNLSGLLDWMSDSLCRLSTGGGFATRQLYTDDAEFIFDGQRPIILNGIADVVTRADLADRLVRVRLAPIPEYKRKSEKTFWREFEAARPRLLGALCDAVSLGLSRINGVTLPELPRLADFAIWAVACEPAYAQLDGFMAAFAANRSSVVVDQLETNSVANAIRQMIGVDGAWTGRAGDLFDLLTPEDLRDRLPGWPKTARGMASAIMRAAPMLRSVGIDCNIASDKQNHGTSYSFFPSIRRAELPSRHSEPPASAAINHIAASLSAAGFRTNQHRPDPDPGTEVAEASGNSGGRLGRLGRSPRSAVDPKSGANWSDPEYHARRRATMVRRSRQGPGT